MDEAERIFIERAAFMELGLEYPMEYDYEEEIADAYIKPVFDRLLQDIDEYLAGVWQELKARGIYNEDAKQRVEFEAVMKAIDDGISAEAFVDGLGL